MKRAFTIAAVILSLSALSACAGNRSEVPQGSTPLPNTPVAPAPATPVAQLAEQTAPAAIPTGNQIGNLAPEFKLNDLNGKSVSLSEFRGKLVLLNFWATW